MRRHFNLVLLSALAVLIAGTGGGKKPAPPPTPVATVAEPAPTVPAVQKAKATPTPAGTAAERLRGAQEKIGDLTADFALTISGAARGGQDLIAQGKIWLASGRRYAVEYQEPEPQSLVSDGTRRWLHLKKINQVQIQSLPPAGSPNDLFLELGGGLITLLSSCQVTSIPALPDKPETVGFELTPRAGTNLAFKKARLWLGGKEQYPVRVVVEAARQVRADFRNVSVHTMQELIQDPEQGLPASVFTFTPPPDAEVIEMF